jgi:aminopeptidase-like protein
LSDIGTIVGCIGDGSVKELEELKKSCKSIDEFLEVARQRADIALVVAAIKAAIGYD